RATLERWKTDTKHRTDIAIPGDFDHTLVEAACRFVKHHHYAAFYALRCGAVALPLYPNKPINRWVNLLLAFTPFCSVKIETTAIFSAFAIVIQNRCNDVCRGSKSFTVSTFQYWNNFSSGINSYLIQKL